MAPWLRFLEAWAVQQLLRTPAFHRAVEKVARQVHGVWHGAPPEEPGGSARDRSRPPTFLAHFVDEVKTQLGTAERAEANAERAEANAAARTPGAGEDSGRAKRAGAEVGEHSADDAWEHIRPRAREHIRPSARGTEGKAAPEARDENADRAWDRARQSGGQAAGRGLMGEYMRVVKEQLSNKKRR